MRRRPIALTLLSVLAIAWSVTGFRTPERRSPVRPAQDPRAGAQSLLANLASPFIANVGQWKHPAKFVHRSGGMTLCLEDRGWLLDLVEPRGHKPRDNKRQDTKRQDNKPQDAKPRQTEPRVRGAALRMTFEGDPRRPEIVGEDRLPGHHNYFLGDDESRWRTAVPLYSSVRYQDLYPGIDLRLREANGVPEYDLLLQPGAELARVSVHVEGALGLSIAANGSLVIETPLGPVIQPRPKTWQAGADGRKREVSCNFTLLGADRFGFAAPGWDPDLSLTIDPGLIWSTFLGGFGGDGALAVSVANDGVITVGGQTWSNNFPTTTGAYDRSRSIGEDAFVSRLDPGRVGRAQLVYSTYLGGNGDDNVQALAVDARGVVTATGQTWSVDFPRTGGAYDTSHNGGGDAYVVRFDPSKTGNAQLAYCTFLGESDNDNIEALAVGANGVVTLAGWTESRNFPTTNGAFDTNSNGDRDAIVSRIDPSKTGNAQLVFSTVLGGRGEDAAHALSVDAAGVVTVAGMTWSTDFPTTSGAYDTTHNGSYDAFVTRLDPSRNGPAQLVYSTFVGSAEGESANAIAVDGNGVATFAGHTYSQRFPTTGGAYDTTHNGIYDAFVSRLDPSRTGNAQLVYSTFLAGSREDNIWALGLDAAGVTTVAGFTFSTDFPTTADAHDRSYNGGGLDGFVARLDPSRTGSAQLRYSTFLGGNIDDTVTALSLDASGVATVVGYTKSLNFPTTAGAFDRNGTDGGFISRFHMGAAFYGDRHEISFGAGGTQKLTVNAGKAHAGRLYWVLGSITGTSPGVTLTSGAGSVTIPLNPDLWTNTTIALANSSVLAKTRGALDAAGQATATLRIPKTNITSAIGVKFHHAYLVYDANNNFYMASNPVPLTLVK